jgi:hypothetical protein
MNTKPTPNDDVLVADLVDQCRAVKAQLGEHRSALRRGDRLELTAVKEAFVQAAAQVAVGLGSLAGRHVEIATPEADRERIVRAAVRFATRPLRRLLAAWGGGDHA